MKRKARSKFREWFVEQYGKRPSRYQTHRLQADLSAAEAEVYRRRLILTRCLEYDARMSSALRGWIAARSSMRSAKKTGVL